MHTPKLGSDIKRPIFKNWSLIVFTQNSKQCTISLLGLSRTQKRGNPLDINFGEFIKWVSILKTAQRKLKVYAGNYNAL